MKVNGVLFDFSGTLFHLEPDVGWLNGYALDRSHVIDLLTSPATPREYLPAELIEAWERRDLDQDTHRMVYSTVLRTALPGLPDEILNRIYEQVPAPTSWMPYPDTEEALRLLRAANIPVAVISNIPWDIRGVFYRTDLDEYVDEYVLSFAEGMMKPDPEIFRRACQRVGVQPEYALMIGDSEEADGGARKIGCQFAAVERLPPPARPHALISALAEHGLAG